MAGSECAAALRILARLLPLRMPAAEAREPSFSMIESRAGRARLGVALVFGSACSACAAPQQTSLAMIAASSIPTRNGVLVVFDLGDCQLTSATFANLNRLDALPGFTVHAVLLQPPDDSVELDQILRAFGIRFAVSADPSSQWESLLMREGLTPPLAMLVRGGRMEALFAGSRFEQVSLLLRTPAGGAFQNPAPLGGSQ